MIEENISEDMFPIEEMDEIYKDYYRGSEESNDFINSTLIALGSNSVELDRYDDVAIMRFSPDVKVFISGLIEIDRTMDPYFCIHKDGAYLLDNAKNILFSIDRKEDRNKYVYITDIENGVNIEVKEFDLDILADEDEELYPKFFTDIKEYDGSVEASVHVKFSKEDLEKTRIYNSKYDTILSAATDIKYKMMAFRTRAEYIKDICEPVESIEDEMPALILFNGELLYAVGHNDYILAKRVNSNEVLQIPYYDMCVLTVAVMKDFDSPYVYEGKIYKNGKFRGLAIKELGFTTYTTSDLDTLIQLHNNIVELEVGVSDVSEGSIEEALLSDFIKEKNKLICKIKDDEYIMNFLREGILFIENNKIISTSNVVDILR